MVIDTDTGELISNDHVAEAESFVAAETACTARFRRFGVDWLGLRVGDEDLSPLFSGRPRR
jgi:hypothetical protein